MKGSVKICGIVLIVGVFILCSCNLPIGQQASGANTTPAVQVQNTEEPKPQDTATTEATAAVPTVTETAAASTAEPTPTPQVINHSTIPGDSTYTSSEVEVDCSTGSRLAPGSNQVNISGCDYWNREWLERPADSASGTYVPALDILWAQAGKSDPWIFLKIKLFDLTNEPPGFKVGFELDSDLDSRGEYLLLANQPTSTTWTTDGVQVWQDTNGDVGGTKPFSYDQNTSDGYETNLFDSGVGKDSDLAWVRISPKDAGTVEFAFKASLLPNQNVFGWWGWAGLDNFSPDKFELVDHDQDAQTWNVDNVCSWIFGESPKEGQLTNLCPVIQPTATPEPTSVSSSGGGCPAGPHFCRLGLFWDSSSCSCKFNFILLPTPVPTATQEPIR